MTDKPRRTDTAAYWTSGVRATAERRPDDPRASDTRSTPEIIAAHLRGQTDAEPGDSLATVHYRGGLDEFQAGIALLASADPRQRACGADVLAQLGWQEHTFLEESVDALLAALNDPDDLVVESAIVALGHRASPRAIEPLLPFVDHPSADIRQASVHGLMPYDTPTVVDALIKLSRDTDRDVRDWATFTLGSQFDSDSPSLRTALHARLTETDPEIREEALVGLARRGETSITPTIQRELEEEFHGDWAAEAAGLLGDPQLLPALRQLCERLEGENAVYFRGSVQSAISACEGRFLNGNEIVQ